MMEASTQPIPLPVKSVMLLMIAAMFLGLAKLDQKVESQTFAGRPLGSKLRLTLGFLSFFLIVVVGVVNPFVAFLLTFFVVGIAVSMEMLASFRRMRRDLQEAETVFGKVSAMFGWTDSVRVASGRRELTFSFPIVVSGYTLLGFFAAAVLVGEWNA